MTPSVVRLCIHSVLQALVPPTSSDMVTAWMSELGTLPPAAPKDRWAPEPKPLPQSREALAASSAVADTPASGAAASKPAKSSVQLPGFSLAGVLVLAAGAVAAVGL